MRRIRFFIPAVLAAIAALFLCGGIQCGHDPPAIYSEGRNGIWLRHDWVGRGKTAGDYAQLATTLRELHITDAYFHAGPLRADGSIDRNGILHAPNLLANLRKFAPEIRVQAWLGQVVMAGGGGPLDLSKERVRSRIVATADELLALGFAGINYDLEPIYSGDRTFLDLLHRTKTVTRARGKILSAAVCRPEPVRGLEHAARLFARYPGYWRREYFLRVAAELDQVAVMTYDSAIAVPALYRGMVAWIVRWSIDRGLPDVLIGVPTYEATRSHYPWVESVGNTLAGLRDGLAGVEKERRAGVGAAIYAEWTTSAKEREEFLNHWIGGK